MKRFACLLLLALATAARGEGKDWSWGDEGPSLSATSEEAFSPSRDPRLLEANPEGRDALAVGQLNIEGALSPEELRALELILLEDAENPTDPQASFAVSADGVDDLEVVDGVVLASGDRQARFLGIRERLCKLGIGFNCKGKDPLKGPVAPSRVYRPGQAFPPPPPPPPPQRPQHVFPPRHHSVTTEAPSAFQGIIDALEPFIPSFGQGTTEKPKPFGRPHGKPFQPPFADRFQTVPRPPQGSLHAKPSTNFAVYQEPKPIPHIAHAPVPLPNHHAHPPVKPVHVNHGAIQPTTVVEHHHKHTTIYQVNDALPHAPPQVYQGQAQTVHAVVTSQRGSGQRVHHAGASAHHAAESEEFVFQDDLAGSSSDLHLSGSQTQSQGVRFESSSGANQVSAQGFSQGSSQAAQHGSRVRFGTSSGGSQAVRHGVPSSTQHGAGVRFGQKINSQGFSQGSSLGVQQVASSGVQHVASSGVQQSSGAHFGASPGVRQGILVGTSQRVPHSSPPGIRVSSSISTQQLGSQGVAQASNQAFQQISSQGHLQGQRQVQLQGHHQSFQDNMAQQHQVLTSVQESVSANAIDPNFRPGKLEHGGFQPLSLLPLYREQAPVYQEDCQCVPVQFCPAVDVIARSAPEDFSQFLDARTKNTEILSNSTDEEAEDESQAVVRTASSSRRGKVLALPPLEPSNSAETTEATTEVATEAFLEETTELVEEVTEEVTEEATEVPEEEVTEAVTESRVRRESDAAEEEEVEAEDPAPAARTASSGRREGRQLTGFTPNSQGCGPNHVCCRRPVFKPRQQFTCGRRNAAGMLGRVKNLDFVKGSSEFGEYPWQAAILKRKEGQVVYQCGGALIDDRHVLTVAHCVKDIHPSEIKVRLGEWDVSSKTEFYAHVEMRASGVYAHPEYDAANLVNDVAIIRLEKAVDFAINPHITPVCLPDKFADFTHQRCTATGWGKDAFTSDSKFSQLLKEVELPVVDYQRCEMALQQARLGSSFSLHQGNICAGGEKDQDTCKGDGGGPLVCSAADGSIQLAGLVSWGIGCGHPGVPGVYVKVSHYLEWIRAITRV
ncbi:uncharacterized protein LOC122262915 [Penaeus japonicus]|uniref:uncharacterized protein LOC122262915 n=1 Tax=Penaeus japonicus TaxID=27405 RepID=UPI001C7145B1|nr:uncharacterized protein LOC122262915 [Penaeus japonicus]